MQFSHLHTHTQYSLLDGANNIKALYKKAVEHKMPAVAITDHGNMFGVFDFVAQASKHVDSTGKPLVKPIVGCEFYVVDNMYINKFTKGEKDKRYHQLFLAKNEEGYKNLVKLCSLGFMEGMYGKYPRIDKNLILQYHKGLIATTCCLGASVPRAIIDKGEAEGEKEFTWWFDLFGDDYYIELQRHGIPDQDKANEVLLKFAKKFNVPVIASNDAHYLDQKDFNAHDILLCINTGEKLSTPALREFNDDDVNAKNYRFAFPNDQFYVKTQDEMLKVFSDIPYAIDNTQQIVDKVDLLNLKKDILLPHFKIPDKFKTQDEYLHHLTYEGAAERYKILTPEVEERLQFELNVIKNMGFAGYFLIVSDFIMHGKNIGVYVGPGRGSAAGSAVAYCIGITNIDPIKYNLLFERFLNPDRKSMPDIDTDFDDEGRQKVIDYVVEKYGREQVAQIITYGTMAAKMSIKDVARVMDLPLSESNALAKLVPDKPGTVLKRVLRAPLEGSDDSLEKKEGLGQEDLENIKRLRVILNDKESLASKVLHEAEILEGSVRNTGIHAAGIIIAPQDLKSIIPVCTQKDSPLLVTQIEGSVIEEAGVIKMDFLGLKTLSILKTAVELIKKYHGVIIDLDELPLDDALTYELYQRGDTNGTFQFESAGMQKYLRDLKPDRLDDLIAMNALYRPGPIEYIPNFIKRKHGLEEISYDLEGMEEYLAETYGITVYQEQVMLLSQKLAGFSKGDADVLRKAMGKKQIAVLNKLKPQFIEGASERGHDAKKLEKVWTDWEAFASYAFNKSHSTCYAVVAYQTGYLKAHYPSEYMAAVLNHAGSKEKITFFMEECRKMGIKVLYPDINESEGGFSVNKKQEIRFGFQGLNGVGDAAVEEIINERNKNGEYLNIYDLVKRVNQRSVNRRSLEALVWSGAFDSFKDITRSQYNFQGPADKETNLERIIKYGQSLQADVNKYTNSLFGDEHIADAPPPKLTPAPELTLVELLEHEKEICGMYLSGHPLNNYQFELNHYKVTPIREFTEIVNASATLANFNRVYRLVGWVIDAQHRISKKGNAFGIVTIEDYEAKYDIMLFGEDYLKYKHFLEKDKSVMVMLYFAKGRFDPNKIEVKISQIILCQDIKKQLTAKLLVQMPAKLVNQGFMSALQQQIKQHPGSVPLSFLLKDDINSLSIGLKTIDYGISFNEEWLQWLESIPETDITVELA
jgi:DNA polymerase III subunit alpha